jgi:hypothetical protein
METQVRTPNAIFGQPQRFLVPLFQRPYVWNEEQQWGPLWEDLERVATRLLNNPAAKHEPHFLGAVVLQQVQSRTGELPERTVIDGQQRLTTLQLLLDALHAELTQIGATGPAGRIEYLIQNDGRFCKHAEDRYKVWPTNRDRPAFNEVLAAESPVDYEGLSHRSARLVQAHRFFSQRAKEWLTREGSDHFLERGEALERSARELLQMVVIDLAADENAQEIFETLNARGAQLTAADLIKNFVFQRLLDDGADVEKAYETHWREFETAFWETEVSAGRLLYQRASLFINHWLISRTGEEIVAREVFTRFKTFADHEAGVPMETMLQQMSRAARVYRHITEAADNTSSDIDRVGLFAYRIKTMESDLMKSVLLALLDAERPVVPNQILEASLDIIESWLTRRMLVRASTKSYSQVAAEVVNIIRQTLPDAVDQALRSYFASQTADTKYWPDDEELAAELTKLPVYRRISRARLRMVLEAIEDDRRGYGSGGKTFAGMRVPRNRYWIEHVMPQRWETYWKSPAVGTPEERSHRLHTLGNLTLLTGKLNESVSNGPWQQQDDERGKCITLREHDVLLINRDLDRYCEEGDWTDQSIEARTQKLVERIRNIWPVPPGHKSSTVRTASPVFHNVDLPDLLSDGLLSVGQTIFPSDRALRQHTGRILSDGRIEVDERVFDTPSGAGHYLRKRATNGWSFWLVDVETKKSLASLRREYLEKSGGGTNLIGEDEDGPADAEEEQEANLTDLRHLQLEFWTAFKAWMEARSNIRLQKAAPQQWLSTRIGRSGFHVSAVISTWNSLTETGTLEMRVQLVLSSDRSKEQFSALAAHKEALQAQIKTELHWHDIEGNKQRRVYVRKDADFRDKSEWPAQFEWLGAHLETFSSAFGPLVRSL